MMSSKGSNNLNNKNRNKTIYAISLPVNQRAVPSFARDGNLIAPFAKLVTSPYELLVFSSYKLVLFV